MSNLKLTGFLIFGLALSMGIILWVMHEQLWASILFVLAAFQALITLSSFKRGRKGKGFKKVGRQ